MTFFATQENFSEVMENCSIVICDAGKNYAVFFVTALVDQIMYVPHCTMGDNRPIFAENCETMNFQLHCDFCVILIGALKY